MERQGTWFEKQIHEPVVKLAINYMNLENVVLCLPRSLVATHIHLRCPTDIIQQQPPGLHVFAQLPVKDHHVFTGLTTNRFGQFFTTVASNKEPVTGFQEQVRVYRCDHGQGSQVNAWNLPRHFKCDDIHSAVSGHLYVLGRFFTWHRKNGVPQLLQTSCVLVYTCDGDYIRQFRESKISQTQEGYIARPLRITTNPQHEVLIADALSNRTVRIQVFDFNGSYLRTLAVFPPYKVSNVPRVRQVAALQVNADGELYLLDNETKQVHILNSMGDVVSSMMGWKLPNHLIIGPTHHQIVISHAGELELLQRCDPVMHCADIDM